MSDQTRRTWIVTITQAAAGLGVVRRVSGSVPNSVTLPPGVYEASSDHLGHALMNTARYHPIPPGCPTDYIRPQNGPFKPLFFSNAEFALIHRLIQLLLGEVAGGSSTIQELAEWIDLRVSSADGVLQAEARLDSLHRALATAYFGLAQNTAVKERPPSICRAGIVWILTASRTKYSKEFLSLELPQQVAILHSISDERNDKHENAGTRFFSFMKAEAIRGFYTSQVGLRELDFKGNAFYARSPGCNS